ncbi:MAG: hypothetical protein QGF53_01910 [Alphaproteobacteria bacterium]|nr:hypothetical protein [Alphaproteobacteria bacterium]
MERETDMRIASTVSRFAIAPSGAAEENLERTVVQGPMTVSDKAQVTRVTATVAATHAGSH